MKLRTVLVSMLFLVGGVLVSHAQAGEYSREEFATEVRQSLENDLLKVWYPRVVDEVDGGYLTDFDADWNPVGPQKKMIVTQARHLWTSSRLLQFFPEKDYLRAVADHGYAFLRDRMWDKKDGGFYWLVDKQGNPTKDKNSGWKKQAYGNAFAIYALVAYYQISDNSEALELAKKTFLWLEGASYDSVYGGYYNHITREGAPIEEPFGRHYPKGQNSSIHLLEAFTALYSVWKDPLLKERLTELYDLIQSKMIDERGFVRLYFEKDWTHLSLADLSDEDYRKKVLLDYVSFGHDVEITYLMLEAREALGIPDDPETLRFGKQLLDHALDHGWDAENPSIYDGGRYQDGACSIVLESKVWWEEAELLNTLVLMARYYPDDPHAYYHKACQVWDYIKSNLIDHERGGWYEEGLDKSPESASFMKAYMWKGAYHDSRAMMNVYRSLKADWTSTAE